jgi:hypothetical protein
MVGFAVYIHTAVGQVLPTEQPFLLNSRWIKIDMNTRDKSPEYKYEA